MTLPSAATINRSFGAIPLRQTRSYSTVAHACAANRQPLLTPCHRVLEKNGLAGFMQGQENGLTIKRRFLANEGGHGYR